MFELFSFVFGGVFRLVPELLRLWDKKNERAHEREMIELNLRADQARATLEMQKAELTGKLELDKAELQALIEATRAQAQTMAKTGNPYLDSLLVLVEVLSATVRPVLTYWYCVVAYGAYKTALYWSLVGEGRTWTAAILDLWTVNDHAVMVSIIGFWFVDRALRKLPRG